MPGRAAAPRPARDRLSGRRAREIDGPALGAISRAYAAAIATKDRPTGANAKTIKGAGVSLVADKEGWQGKALNAEQAKQAIAELGGERHITVVSPVPEDEATTTAGPKRAQLPANPPAGTNPTR